jgi:hypothetical protein
MIQDFVPARTSLASGVVIKQHLLERNKYPQPQVEWKFEDYSGSVYSQQIWDDNISGSYIETSTIGNIFGGTGGTFDSYNFTGSTLPPTFINNTQSWLEPVKTPYGLTYISQSTQQEFYNGELPGSEFVVEDGELNSNNLYKYPNREGNILDWGGTFSVLGIVPPGSYTQNYVLGNISNVVLDDSINYTLTDQTIKINSPTITPLQITASFTTTWNTSSGAPQNYIFNLLQPLIASFYFTRKTTPNQAYIDVATPGKLISTSSYFAPPINTTTGTFTSTTTISRSWSPNTDEIYNMFIVRSNPLPILYWNLTCSVNITINQTLPPAASPVSSSQLANYSLFEFGDYNAIIDNVEDAETSQYFLDVDYSQNPVIPINQVALVNNSAILAPVQDSNYNSYAWSNIRYNGVRYNSIKINQ